MIGPILNDISADIIDLKMCYYRISLVDWLFVNFIHKLLIFQIPLIH